MKKILLLLTTLFFISCQIQYDGGSKFIVQTKVVDKNGTPIPEVPVSVRVSSGGLSDEISLSETNKDGFATLLFPPPENEGATISISYFPDYYNDATSIYYAKEIDQLKKTDFSDYLYDTGIVILLKEADVTEFTVLKEQINQSNQITAFSTDAVSTESIPSSFSELNYYFPISIKVLKNHTFTVNYSITNYSTSPQTVTNYSEQVTAGNVPFSYTIVY